MKSINGERVYKKATKTTKKVKVNEAVVGLVASLKELKDHKKINIDEATFNTIVVYYALLLLAKTHNSKEYEEIFNSCLDESEA